MRTLFFKSGGSGGGTANTTANTSLIGGVAGALDAQITAGGALATNTIMHTYVSASDKYYMHVLVSGTDSENSPWIVRPDDFNAITNAVVWKLIQAWQGGLPRLWNSDDSSFHRIQTAGATTNDSIIIEDIGDAT